MCAYVWVYYRSRGMATLYVCEYVIQSDCECLSVMSFVHMHVCINTAAYVIMLHGDVDLRWFNY